TNPTGAERRDARLHEGESGGSARPIARFCVQRAVTAYFGSPAGLALGVSKRIENRRSAGVAARRSGGGYGKGCRQRNRPQGTDARTHGSRSQCFGDPAAALRAL